MGSVNRVILVGRLGAVPELRYSPKGTAMCSLRVATSESWTDKGGDKQERTEWHRVSVFGPQAEACGKYLEKGSQVCVEGRIQTRSWDKDGQKHYVTEVVATPAGVVFLDKGKGPREQETRNSGPPIASGNAPRSKAGQQHGNTEHNEPSGIDEDIPF